MRFFAVIAFCLFCHSLFGQSGLIANRNLLSWSVPTSLSSKPIRYADVNGDCFWRQEWLPAQVIMQNGTQHTLAKAKLNFFSNAIHYIDEKGDEVAAQGGIMEVVFSSSSDSSKNGVFKVINGPAVNFTETLAQVLVDGKTQFFKATPTKLVKREVDPLLAKVEWNFESRETYFIQENGELKELKGLSKAHLFDVIIERDEDEAWLKAHGNKLRKEGEVTAYITYRNSTTK